MSKEESPTLTRSPSGSLLWPPKRPPIKSNTNNKSTKEGITDFLIKESTFHNITNKEQKSHQEEFPSEPNVEDDEPTEDGEEENNSCDHNDDESDSERKLEEIDDQEDGTDSSVTDRCKKHDQKQKEDTKINYIFDINVILDSPFMMISCLTLVVVTFSLCCCSFENVNSTKSRIDINKIKETFPTQDEDLWTSFESGVQDVVKFERPSTFIFLYKTEAEETLENIIKQFTKYAVCEITDCSKEPITVTDTELNSPEIIEDYGRLIEKYQNKLQQNGVMVIKHIENVQGTSAQAFHSFCDEFSPLVEKSLFIFTMKADAFDEQNKMNFVEEYFRNKWTDIKTDTFNALITRITSMVLEIRP